MIFLLSIMFLFYVMCQFCVWDRSPNIGFGRGTWKITPILHSKMGLALQTFALHDVFYTHPLCKVRERYREKAEIESKRGLVSSVKALVN